jgi:hypothetical protein
MMHLVQYWSCAYLKMSRKTSEGTSRLCITGVYPGVVEQAELEVLLELLQCLTAIWPRISSACAWYVHATINKHASSTFARVPAVKQLIFGA